MRYPCHRIVTYCIVFKLISLPGIANAFSGDHWPGLLSDSEKNHPITLRLHGETAGDNVAYAPNLADGTHAEAKDRPRYLAGGVALDWNLNERVDINVSLLQRKFATLRDRFNIQSYAISLRYLMPGKQADRQLILSIDAAGNQSPGIHKNSFTRYGDHFLRSVEIQQPFDQQIQGGVTAVVDLNPNTAWSVFTGLGYIRTGHSSISGVSESSEGCPYRFTTGGGTGSLEQIGPCGDVLAFNQEFPDYQAVQARLGFDPDKDINHEAVFWRIGGSFQFSKERISGSVGYYYQHFDRGEFDERIRDRKNIAFTHNHTLGARVNYRLKKNLSISAKAEYNRRQFLGHLPILYTGVTSDRFSEDVLYFSLSLSLGIGPEN